MRISKFDVFWIKEGTGYLITWDENYKLYTVKEQIVKDLLGDLDVDVQFLYKKHYLEPEDLAKFKDYMIYLKYIIIKDLGELIDTKIYRTQDDVFYKYVNGKAVELYNPIKMKERAEYMLEEYINELSRKHEDYMNKLRRKQDENTNPK